MADARISDLERSAVSDLVRLAADRDAAETEVARRYKTDRAQADRQIDERRQAIQRRFELDTRSNEAEHDAATQEINARHDEDSATALREYKGERFKVSEQADHDENATKKSWEEARWTAETVYEAKEPLPREEFEKIVRALRTRAAVFQSMEAEATELLRRYHQRIPAVALASSEPAATIGEPTDAKQQLEEQGNAAGEALARLRRAFVPRLFEGMKPFGLFLVPFVAAAALVGWQTDWKFNSGLPYAGAGALIVAIGMLVLLYVAARGTVRRIWAEFMRPLERARKAREHCLVLASEKRAREEAVLKQHRDDELDKAQHTYQPRLQRIREVRVRLLKELDERHERRMREIVERRDRELAENEERFAARTEEIQARFRKDSATADAEAASRLTGIDTGHDRDWTNLESAWKAGMTRIRQVVDRVAEFNGRRFPAWDSPIWTNWKPPSDFSPAVRYGEFDVNLAAIPGGIPKDERLLDAGPLQFRLPAVLDFPTRSSLLIEVGEEGRDRAVDVLQNVMMRLLTSFPPGKVRFTIVDPVGLGQNFAGFMHLADYEEAFVADRIWTEARHIEQRLTDITEHMENVIQKYLRNDFATITDYNEHAGEIAEPFRFLVIANFPVNFNETAARRLVSIIDSGPRCGVYTLITFDTRQPMPQGVQPEDLRKGGVNLTATKGGIICREGGFELLPLSLDPAPTPEFLTRILHIVGEAAKHLTRVEVPFEHVVPAKEEYWTSRSDRDIVVPLGRAGATKLQTLSLGHGIAQHVLIAGKTGSGKSTLLHVLVTNLSLYYRPDEVEFYLVDFKKGVEFKTYATHHLPHARAVAIESDREFGLSVLQRVDSELKRRGEIFRRLGVQDLGAYRRTGSTERIPRTLLIIDEFQEFFVEDDKLSQDAALLLDRLVRQGRAFGIHVILGSQTLAGAYSLARSTIGQMAVRVALQCSEADAMLIMSDDNSAARLLSRPGEAIYNDQGGLVEGNNPFQIVWLPDHVREKYLKEVEALAKKENYRPPEPQIVFEGNVPADIRRNALLESALAASPATKAPAAMHAWLGDAIAIKDPTAAVFRRQSGCNLLMVGQRDEAALAMQATSLIALIAQTPPDQGIFYLLDGMAADAPLAGSFERLARHIPHDVRVVGWHDVEGAMAEIGEELERRRGLSQTDPAPIFLFVYALQRFRMLRQAEDFGFGATSGEAKTATPEKIFGEVLRDGPPLGFHTIVWCDTMNNLSRALDRHAMKEFDLRVLFQMSSTDSSNLIDSPAAGNLGATRALLHSEDHGILEKFRPYAMPEEDWLDEVEKRLRTGSPQRR